MIGPLTRYRRMNRLGVRRTELWSGDYALDRPPLLIEGRASRPTYENLSGQGPTYNWVLFAAVGVLDDFDEFIAGDFRHALAAPGQLLGEALSGVLHVLVGALAATKEDKVAAFGDADVAVAVVEADAQQKGLALRLF